MPAKKDAAWCSSWLLPWDKVQQLETALNTLQVSAAADLIQPAHYTP
jgi:hypothetical protein